ncbi:MAG: histidine kinase dimerization/phospho-acceptor domain-containing protein [Xanthobacteraceae bacterium]|uniref:sensor histidine kinase n=1 Tax=Pseudolabrys sp. TaxID=1960880 RepID=UPI003D0FD735
MNGSHQPYALLAAPALAAHAMSATPAWLWSGDGTRLLWSNPVGAAVQRAHADALAARAAQIAQSLPQGAARLERLRGPGAGVGGVLTCRCQRIALADGGDGILIAAVEPAKTSLSIDERAQALLAGHRGPAAIFSASGDLIAASPEAAASLNGAKTLAALGLGDLAATALRDGTGSNGAAMLMRLGNGNGGALLAVFGGADAVPATAPSASPAVSPAAPAETTRRDVRRFIWQSDADGHFTILTADFFDRADARTAALSGKSWREIAGALGLDPDGRIAAALTSQDTWSGIATAWPSAGGGLLAVELSGLPMFDRERSFQGYRGFGLCRDETPAATATVVAAPPAAAHVPPQTAEPAAPQQPPSTVVPFPAPSLSDNEQSAFHELARQLGDRLKASASKPLIDDDFGPERAEPVADRQLAPPQRSDSVAPPAPVNAGDERPILDKLPVGILVYRYNTLIYANRALLDWTGYRTLDALTSGGGLDSLFIEPAAGPGSASGNGGAKSLAIATRDGNAKPVEGRLFSVTWDGDNALVLMINTLAAASREPAPQAAPDKTAELARRELESENRNLRAALDTAADGVLLIDATGRIIFANSGAAALFSRDRDALSDMTFGELFAPESRRAALDYLDRLNRDATAGIINPGKEMMARAQGGGLVPLHITVGRVGPDGEKFCAVLRDITALKKAEEDLVNARHQAELLTAEKSEFLAKISHDIRTPLNAIIGFSEVMMEERFGPIGNERYQDYAQGIHASGERLIALLNDLLDLARIETGKLDLAMTPMNLNEIAQQCVAALQPQANRDRVIIRSSLPANLPAIVADSRAVRQIVLNLLAHSIKFTGAGGQVIVSTARNENGDVVLRVRDTGAGLSDRELVSALEPFRNIATAARWGASGTGLDLPIIKALAEANRATFTITSGSDQGTLVEVAFPATRVIA